MALNELSPKKIENAKPKDADYKLTDGGSLYLLVKKNGTKAWRMNLILTLHLRTAFVS